MAYTMNRRIILIVSISALMLSISSAHAGAVRLWTPKELFERSEVVLIGCPIHIEATGKKGTMRFNERLSPIPTDIYSANVQIIQVIKGDELMDRGRLRVKEVEVIFSRVGKTVIIDTQYVHRISLKKDGLFLFYLNPTKDGTYLNALEGEVNDSQAAKSLIITATEQDGVDKPATATEPTSEVRPN